MLKELNEGKVFGNINKSDSYGRNPLDYALGQKTGKMAALLKANKAIERIKIPYTPPAIESAQYPEDSPPFKEHAREYIEEN